MDPHTCSAARRRINSNDSVFEATAHADWLRHMRAGQFEAAWRISDRLLHLRRGISCQHWPRHQQYVWNGTPLIGKRVLVRCYHGLGDTLQFIRYMPLLKAVAAHVM